MQNGNDNHAKNTVCNGNLGDLLWLIVLWICLERGRPFEGFLAEMDESREKLTLKIVHKDIWGFKSAKGVQDSTVRVLESLSAFYLKLLVALFYFKSSPPFCQLNPIEWYMESLSQRRNQHKKKAKYLLH